MRPASTLRLAVAEAESESGGALRFFRSRHAAAGNIEDQDAA